MKKLLVCLLFVYSGSMVFAQTQQGSASFGGGVSYSGSNTPNSKNNTVSILPSLGFFTMQDLAIGLNLGYLHSKQVNETGQGSTTQSNDFVIGPFVRKYIHTSNTSFAFLFEGGTQFTFGSSKFTSGAIESKGNDRSIMVYVRPGFNYFFNEHWAFELGFTGISYRNTDPDTDVDDNNNSSFSVGLNSLMPSDIGIRYFWNK